MSLSAAQWFELNARYLRGYGFEFCQGLRFLLTPNSHDIFFGIDFEKLQAVSLWPSLQSDCTTCSSISLDYLK